MTQPRQPRSQIERNATFTAVLAVVAVVAAILAGSADAPIRLLENEIASSIEVGLAIFLGMYVPVVAIWLALQGRALTKITAGPIGAEAEKVSEEATEEVQKSLDNLTKEMATVRQVSTAAVAGVSNLATRADLLSGEVAEIRPKIDAEPP